MATVYQFNDGGRYRAGYKGGAKDCVVRACAIALGEPYQAVYDELFELQKDYIANTRAKLSSSSPSPKDGTYKAVYKKYLESKGWTWVPTMFIGSGCRVHLRAGELPKGRIICRVSRHLVAVIDGVVHDSHDSRRDGKRCVYGYWIKKEPVA